MGGKYIPLIEGEIYGFEIGIDTELILWEHTRKLDYEKLEGEYLVGIGVGFTKAQQVRVCLKEHHKNLTFEEKLTLYKFLVEKYLKDYQTFINISKDFLANIDHWKVTKTPIEVCEEVEYFLHQENLQRALDSIDKYNYEKYRLKLITEYEEIKFLLPNLRSRKQRQEIDTITYQKEKAEIKQKLQEWLRQRSV